jgi:hypothetical protein
MNSAKLSDSELIEAMEKDLDSQPEILEGQFIWEVKVSYPRAFL